MCVIGIIENGKAGKKGIVVVKSVKKELESKTSNSGELFTYLGGKEKNWTKSPAVQIYL